MSKQYRMYSLKNNNENFISLSEEEFTLLKEAKQKLSEVLHIEEKFNFIIENYLEFERELVNITLSKMIFPVYISDWSLSANDIHLVNRRIVNLLTTSRLYIDQISHDLNRLCGQNTGIPIYVEKLKSREYDSVFGYRVMEALRNYVQHRGLPIHLLSYKVEKIDTQEGNEFKHKVSPIIRVEDLERDGKFKKTILDELRQANEKVDLKVLTREYIQSILNVHCFIRDLLLEDVKIWERTVNYAYEEYEKKFEKSEMITIIELDNNGFEKEMIHILYDILKRRKWLEEKNKRSNDFTKNFITGEK